MRLLKVSQQIEFVRNTFYDVFPQGQQVTLNGHLLVQNYECARLVRGYMKKEPVNSLGSLTFYVKGSLGIGSNEFNKDLILMQTTKFGTERQVPFTMCSYFPHFNDNGGFGYLDETDGIPYIRNGKEKYFFLCGEYIAKTKIQIVEIPMLTEKGETNPEYVRANKKTKRMISRYRKAKSKGMLYLGRLFDVIQPDEFGGCYQLGDTYPSDRNNCKF